MLLMLIVSCNEKQSKKTKDEIALEKSLNDFDNSPSYKVLTAEIIDKSSDENLEQVIYDNITENFKGDFDNSFKYIEKLSKGQQMFWSTSILEGEVNNGGFNQFYFNSSGQFAEMAVNGYKLIKAKKYTELVFRANKIYEENKERLAIFNDGSVERFSESYKDNPLNKLDDEFYDLEKNESTGGLRIKYIREHKNEFTTENL